MTISNLDHGLDLPMSPIHRNKRSPQPSMSSTFTFSFASRAPRFGAGTPSRLPDRRDIDMHYQQAAIREHRAAAQEHAAVQDWELTKASREDHRRFALMLVCAGRRYQRKMLPAGSTWKGGVDLTDNALALGLLLHVRNQLNSPVGPDRYAIVLQELAAMFFFTQRPTQG